MTTILSNPQIHGSHYPNGNWKSQNFCDKTTKSGYQVTWYKNGNIKSSGNFENNKPTGLHTLWFFDGTKRAEINYKDGKRDGDFIIWHTNGRIKSQGSYQNGQVTGIWTFWYFNGQKYKETDTIRGTRLYWYDNGQIKSKQYRVFWKGEEEHKDFINYFRSTKNWDSQGNVMDGDIITVIESIRSYTKDSVMKLSHTSTGAITYFNKDGTKQYEIEYQWIFDSDWYFDIKSDRYQWVDFVVSHYSFFNKKGNKTKLLECCEKTRNEDVLPYSYLWNFYNDKGELIFEYNIKRLKYLNIDLYDELTKINHKELKKTLTHIEKYKSIFEKQLSFCLLDTQPNSMFPKALFTNAQLDLFDL